MRGLIRMPTINKNVFKNGVNFFGCPKTCDDLKIAVRVEFECSHPHQAFDWLEQILDGQKRYEITFNSDNETCVVLIYPEEIKLSSDSSNEVEEIIEEVEDLEELEEVKW